jgi:hypothetical protein
VHAYIIRTYVHGRRHMYVIMDERWSVQAYVRTYTYLYRLYVLGSADHLFIRTRVSLLSTPTCYGGRYTYSLRIWLWKGLLVNTRTAKLSMGDMMASDMRTDIAYTCIEREQGDFERLLSTRAFSPSRQQCLRSSLPLGRRSPCSSSTWPAPL